MKNSVGNYNTNKVKMTSVFGVNVANIPVGYATINGITSINDSGYLNSSEGTLFQVNAISPNGQWLAQAYAGQTGARPFVYIKKINDDGFPQYPSSSISFPSYNASNFVRQIAWHPSEELLVALGDDAAQGGNKILLIRRNSAGLWELSSYLSCGSVYADPNAQTTEWSPNGKYLIAKVYNGSDYLNVFKYDGSTLTAMGTRPSNQMSSPSNTKAFKYSPDGAFFASIQVNGYYLNVAPTQSDQMVDNTNSFAQNYISGYQLSEVAWSPDSKILTVGTLNGRVVAFTKSGSSWGGGLTTQDINFIGGSNQIKKIWWDKGGGIMYFAYGAGYVYYVKRINDTTIDTSAYYLGTLHSSFASVDEAWRIS